MIVLSVKRLISFFLHLTSAFLPQYFPVVFLPNIVAVFTLSRPVFVTNFYTFHLYYVPPAASDVKSAFQSAIRSFGLPLAYAFNEPRVARGHNTVSHL